MMQHKLIVKKKTISHKALIAMHPVYDGYRENIKYGLLFFYKKGSGTNDISSQALHKSVIKKCR